MIRIKAKCSFTAKNILQLRLNESSQRIVSIFALQKQNAGHGSEIFCTHITFRLHTLHHIHSTSAETGENQNVAIERRQASRSARTTRHWPTLKILHLFVLLRRSRRRMYPVPTTLNFYHWTQNYELAQHSSRIIFVWNYYMLSDEWNLYLYLIQMVKKNRRQQQLTY